MVTLCRMMSKYSTRPKNNQQSKTKQSWQQRTDLLRPAINKDPGKVDEKGTDRVAFSKTSLSPEQKTKTKTQTTTTTTTKTVAQHNYSSLPLFLSFPETRSHYTQHGWPRACNIDQAALELDWSSCPCLLSAGIKRICHHAQISKFAFNDSVKNSNVFNSLCWKRDTTLSSWIVCTFLFKILCFLENPFFCNLRPKLLISWWSSKVFRAL